MPFLVSMHATHGSCYMDVNVMIVISCSILLSFGNNGSLMNTVIIWNNDLLINNLIIWNNDSWNKCKFIHACSLYCYLIHMYVYCFSCSYIKNKTTV